jgi:hypothetical protein
MTELDKNEEITEEAVQAEIDRSLPDYTPPEPPAFYEVILLFNSSGRICGWKSVPPPVTDEEGNQVEYSGDTAKVMREEWERFNLTAGRRHKVVDGIVVYDGVLEPALPDGSEGSGN